MKKYPEYKHFELPWLREIPSHWSVLRNKNLFVEKKEVVGDESDNYTLLSLTLHGIIPRDTSTGKGKFPASFETYKIISKGDMVFCLFDMDETPRTVGLSNHDGMLTGAYNVFRIQRENPRFIYYYYLALDNAKALKPLYSGLRKTINTGRFMSLSFPTPPREEQDQIVRYLDWQISKINRLIATKKKEIELLRELKIVAINTRINRNKKKSLRLKFLVNDINEKTTPKGKYYIGMENIVSWESEFVCTDSTVDGDCKHFQPNDILFGKLRPYLAKVFSPTQEGACSGEFLVLRGFKGYLPFLKYFLLSHDFISLVNASTYGAKMPRANWDFIGNCMVPYPPQSEQKEIAEGLDQFSEKVRLLITQNEKEIDFLVELKTRLISDVVTGQIDIRGIEVPEFEMVEIELTEEDFEDNEVKEK